LFFVVARAYRWAALLSSPRNYAGVSDFLIRDQGLDHLTFPDLYTINEKRLETIY